jgi:methionyl aminopeptidase
MKPDSKEWERWRRAARVAAEARELGASLLAPGTRRRDVADRVEEYIRSHGAQPAFPTNLSRNVEAAHFTPPPDDEEVFQSGDLVKVDVGAHIDGAIADTAMTVEVGGGRRHENLTRAVREGVEAGIAEVRAGVAVDALSRAIERAITARGVKPVTNLTGHTIETYLLHGGKSIPNAGGMSAAQLEEGEIVAIEPFATNGRGRIENGPFGNIVRFPKDPSEAAPKLAPLFERFRTLPFTARWVDDPAERALLTRSRRFLQTYPVFVESGGGLVAQAEHTVLVRRDDAEVLTRAGPSSAP